MNFSLYHDNTEFEFSCIGMCIHTLSGTPAMSALIPVVRHRKLPWRSSLNFLLPYSLHINRGKKSYFTFLQILPISKEMSKYSLLTQLAIILFFSGHKC